MISNVFIHLSICVFFKNSCLVLLLILIKVVYLPLNINSFVFWVLSPCKICSLQVIDLILSCGNLVYCLLSHVGPFHLILFVHLKRTSVLISAKRHFPLFSSKSKWFHDLGINEWIILRWFCTHVGLVSTVDLSAFSRITLRYNLKLANIISSFLPLFQLALALSVLWEFHMIFRVVFIFVSILPMFSIETYWTC